MKALSPLPILTTLLIVTLAAGCTSSDRSANDHQRQIKAAPASPSAVVAEFIEESFNGQIESASAKIGAAESKDLDPTLKRADRDFAPSVSDSNCCSDGKGGASRLPNEDLAARISSDWPKIIRDKRIRLGSIVSVEDLNGVLQVRTRLLADQRPFCDARFIVKMIEGNWKIVAIWVP